MYLEIKNLKVDIFTLPSRHFYSLPGPYHYQRGRGKGERGPIKTFFEMYCLKSVFLKHVTEERTFCF